MKAAVISERGIREAMEDAYFVDLDFAGRGWAYVGVYDGHNGTEAASSAAERLHQLFRERLLSGLSPQTAFVESYEAASQEMERLGSGAAAVDLLITGDKAYAANAGDARAIVVGRRHVTQLTTDHRLDDPGERLRILEMGGAIGYPYTYRGAQGIMPTRTLGDSYFKPVGVIATPSVSEHDIAADDLLVLAACDGLFDYLENEEVAAFCRQFTELDMLLEALKQEVLVNRSGSDNLTVVAVSLQQ